MLARAALLAVFTISMARPVVAEDPVAQATPAPAGAAVTAPAARPMTGGEKGPPHGRTLNGHVFMPATTVPGALVTTSLTSSMVLAYGQTSSTIQVGDRTFSGDFDYAGVGGYLGYEYAFLPWLSARVNLTELLYSGIDGESALTIGTTLQSRVVIGATASMPIGDTLRIGFLVDAGVGPGLALNLSNGIQNVIDNCKEGDCNIGDLGAMFGTQNARTVQPAFALNWAPTRPFGLTANVAYLYINQDQTGENFNGHAISLGGAAEYDFHAMSGVPIGLQLTFNWSAPLSGTNLQHVSDVGGGIFYTGREHLAAGVSVVARRFAVNPDVDRSWSTILSTVGLRYYW